MSAFDVLERQLRDSARRRRRRIRLAPAVVALAAAAALLAVLLSREPDPSDERPATPPVATWTPRIEATISRSPVPPEQLRALAVLRRPPTAADRSPAVRRALRVVARDRMRGVRVDAVRLLARSRILVPVEHVTGLAQPDVLCLYTPVSNGVGGTCATFADLYKHGHIGWPGPPFGLVPDGVASVKLRVRGGRTIAAPVRGNVYAVDEDVFAIQPPLWLDASGHEIPRR